MPRSRACDPQQLPLHEAEREFYPKRKGQKDFAGNLTNKEANELIQKVRRLFKLPPVHFCHRHQPRSAAAAYVEAHIENHEVKSVDLVMTGTNAVSAQVILHEMAHVVTDYHFGVYTEAHGREFVGVMSWLFEYFQVLPADAFGLILRRHGVKRRPVTYCSPEALGKIRAKRLDKSR